VKFRDSFFDCPFCLSPYDYITKTHAAGHASGRIAGSPEPHRKETRHERARELDPPRRPGHEPV
jgi:hypothetical protein